jgi:hypothetical protein
MDFIDDIKNSLQFLQFGTQLKINDFGLFL